MTLTLIINLILLLQTSLVVQQEKDQKGSVEGVVARIGTGEPVVGAEIKLTRVGGPSDTAAQSIGETIGRPLSTVSDRYGRFVFKDLDVGSYHVTAARNGYTKLEYGRRATTGTGTVVTLTKGQALKDIIFRLTPTGNVNGNVRDVSGEPLSGFQVLLLHPAYSPTGGKSFQAIGLARTDDRGAYRFYWITPGRYYLSAGRGNGPYENSGFRNPNEVETQPYPTTYYPGTLDPSKAQVVEVLPGEELNGVEFILPQQELYRIRGKLVDATTGKPPRNAELRIFASAIGRPV